MYYLRHVVRGNNVRYIVTYARRPNLPSSSYIQYDTSLVSYLIRSLRLRAYLIGPSVVASGRRLIEGEIVIRSYITGLRGRIQPTFIYGI